MTILTSNEKTHAPITPTVPSDSNRVIVGDYVEKYMLAHHFAHYYNWRCQRMVPELASVISTSAAYTLKLMQDGKSYNEL